MRLLLLLFLCAAACGDDTQQGFHNTADIDAFVECDSTAYIVAPVAGEHYAPNLVTIASVRFAALASVVSVSIVDANGRTYAAGPLTTTTIDTVGPVAEWSFALVPNGRYTLTLSGPEDYAWCPQHTVTFFTSAD